MRSYLLALCLLAVSLPACLGENQTSDANKFSGNVSFNDTLSSKNTGSVQSISETASRYYVDRNFAEAEALFVKALELAKKNKAAVEQIARLTCNLAATYRQEKKYEEAQRYFEQSVELCRSGHLSISMCNYVAKQYAGLLRKQGQNGKAEEILTCGEMGFQISKPTVSAGAPVGGLPSTLSLKPLLDKNAPQFPVQPSEQGQHKIVAFGFGMMDEASYFTNHPRVNPMREIPNCKGISIGYVGHTLMPGPGSDCKVTTELVMNSDQKAISLAGVNTRSENGQLVASWEGAAFHGNTISILWVLQNRNPTKMYYHLRILIDGVLDRETDFEI